MSNANDWFLAALIAGMDPKVIYQLDDKRMLATVPPEGDAHPMSPSPDLRREVADLIEARYPDRVIRRAGAA